MMKMKSQSVNTIAVHYFVEIKYKDINLKNSFSCEKMYSKCCWYKIEEADQIDDVYGYCNPECNTEECNYAQGDCVDNLTRL